MDLKRSSQIQIVSATDTSTAAQRIEEQKTLMIGSHLKERYKRDRSRQVEQNFKISTEKPGAGVI